MLYISLIEIAHSRTYKQWLWLRLLLPFSKSKIYFSRKDISLSSFCLQLTFCLPNNLVKDPSLHWTISLFHKFWFRFDLQKPSHCTVQFYLHFHGITKHKNSQNWRKLSFLLDLSVNENWRAFFHLQYKILNFELGMAIKYGSWIENGIRVHIRYVIKVSHFSTIDVLLMIFMTTY